MDIKTAERDIRSLIAESLKPERILLEHDGRTIIYGAGETGVRTLGLLRRIGVDFDFFLDQKAADISEIVGAPVLNPSEVSPKDSDLVIVALFNHTTDVMSVIKSLRETGYSNLISYTELFISYSDLLPPHYWLCSPDLYAAHVEELCAVFSMLEDGASRELFFELLRYRLTGDPSFAPRYDADSIYFPSDLGVRKRPDRFIDCGAFSGDTLVSVRERFGVVEAIRAFEPDPSNYEELVRLNANMRFAKDTVLFPCGVWSSAAQLRFDANRSAAGSVNADGERIIQCVALDDCLCGFEPYFIKMDIEGSEIEALKGAERMISSARPDLAISIYHRPSHLWEIPQMIKKIFSGYGCFMRAHGANGYDTVFYAYV